MSEASRLKYHGKYRGIDVWTDDRLSFDSPPYLISLESLRVLMVEPSESEPVPSCGVRDWWDQWREAPVDTLQLKLWWGSWLRPFDVVPL